MENDHEEMTGAAECREPTLEDLKRLCADLNAAGAKYIVVGGFAIIQAGYDRRTMDIDLLIDVSAENERHVVAALQKMPDRAIDEMEPGDVASLGVVRVADEFMVDLMKSGCGITYQDAINDAVWRDVEGVRIPFASPATLWRMKQTLREKDALDRLFLQARLRELNIPLDPPLAKAADPIADLPAWLQWLVRKWSPK